ncbi:hypothetical protein X975_24968, partial [Stegodyphus mimosarum]
MFVFVVAPESKSTAVRSANERTFLTVRDAVGPALFGLFAKCS